MRLALTQIILNIQSLFAAAWFVTSFSVQNSEGACLGEAIALNVISRLACRHLCCIITTQYSSHEVMSARKYNRRPSYWTIGMHLARTVHTPANYTASHRPLYNGNGRHLLKALRAPLWTCPNVESTHESKLLAGRRPLTFALLFKPRDSKAATWAPIPLTGLGPKKTVCAKLLWRIRRFSPLQIHQCRKRQPPKQHNSTWGLPTRQSCSRTPPLLRNGLRARVAVVWLLSVCKLATDRLSAFVSCVVALVSSTIMDSAWIRFNKTVTSAMWRKSRRCWHARD